MNSEAEYDEPRPRCAVMYTPAFAAVYKLLYNKATPSILEYKASAGDYDKKQIVDAMILLTKPEWHPDLVYCKYSEYKGIPDLKELLEIHWRAFGTGSDAWDEQCMNSLARLCERTNREGPRAVGFQHVWGAFYSAILMFPAMIQWWHLILLVNSAWCGEGATKEDICDYVLENAPPHLFEAPEVSKCIERLFTYKAIVLGGQASIMLPVARIATVAQAFVYVIVTKASADVLASRIGPAFTGHIDTRMASGPVSTDRSIFECLMFLDCYEALFCDRTDLEERIPFRPEHICQELSRRFFRQRNCVAQTRESREVYLKCTPTVREEMRKIISEGLVDSCALGYAICNPPCGAYLGLAEVFLKPVKGAHA